MNTDTTVLGSSSTLFGSRNNIIGTYNRIGEGTIGNTSTFKEVTNANVLGSENVVKSNNTGIVGINNTIDAGTTGSFILGNNVTINAQAAQKTATNTSNFDGSVALGNNTTVAMAQDTHSYTIDGKVHNFAGIAPVGTVSVGASGKERTITNLAAGRISGSSTDAINGSQLYALVEQANASSIHFVSINSKDASKANYGNDGAKGIDGIAIGVQAKSLDNYAIAMGSNANSSGVDSIAIGKDALTTNSSAIAIGAESSANTNWSALKLTDTY